MSDELIKWECPNCGNVDEDIDLQETHCSGCGLVVFVSDGDAVSQEWFIDPRPTPRAVDLTRGQWIIKMLPIPTQKGFINGKKI